MLQKFVGPLVGAPFCGAPVRPNMLDMPKSVTACIPKAVIPRKCAQFVGVRCYCYTDIMH